MRPSTSPALRALVLPLAALLSCSGSSSDAVTPPTVTELAMTSPELTIEPGAEKMLCWYQTLPSDDDVWVTKFEGAQGPGGHHVVAFTTLEKQPDGKVEDCTAANAKMELWRLVIAAPVGNRYQLPQGYGLRIPGGTQLMFQSHYINTTKTALKTKDTVRFTRSANGSQLTPIAPFTSSVLKYTVEPKTATSIKYECVLDRPMKVFIAMGHMHEHGKSIRIEAGPRAMPREIYRVDAWEPSFRDQAPVSEWPLDKPLLLEKGDIYRVSCDWQSTAELPLKFPSEMCASLAFFYPASDPAVCVGELVP